MLVLRRRENRSTWIKTSQSRVENQQQTQPANDAAVLSVRFEAGVPLLLAPAGADNRGPKAPFSLEENAGIQPAIHKKVPTGAPAGAGSY